MVPGRHASTSPASARRSPTVKWLPEFAHGSSRPPARHPRVLPAGDTCVARRLVKPGDEHGRGGRLRRTSWPGFTGPLACPHAAFGKGRCERRDVRASRIPPATDSLNPLSAVLASLIQRLKVSKCHARRMVPAASPAQGCGGGHPLSGHDVKASASAILTGSRRGVSFELASNLPLDGSLRSGYRDHH